MKQLVPVLFLLIIFVSGCKKTYIQNHYTGSFIFTVIRTEDITQGPNQSHTADTFPTQGTIEYDKQGEFLKIGYLPSGSLKCLIDKEGNISNYDLSLPTANGHFINENEISFSSQWGFDQYTGWTGNDYVTGIRLVKK